jgi:hypothetical protein
MNHVPKKIMLKIVFVSLFTIIAFLLFLRVFVVTFLRALISTNATFIKQDYLNVTAWIFLEVLLIVSIFILFVILYTGYKQYISILKTELKFINNMKILNTAKGFIVFLRKLDSHRSSKEYPLMNFFVVKKVTYLKATKKYDPKFWEEINGFLKLHTKSYRKIRYLWNVLVKPIILLSVLTVITALWAVFLTYLHIDLLPLLAFPPIVLYLIVIYLFIVAEGTRLRNKVGKEHEEELKSNAQKVINYLGKFLRENNLDPKDFPIELLHNDYENLVYEEKGKGRYLAFLKI